MRQVRAGLSSLGPVHGDETSTTWREERRTCGLSVCGAVRPACRVRRRRLSARAQRDRRSECLAQDVESPGPGLFVQSLLATAKCGAA